MLSNVFFETITKILIKYSALSTSILKVGFELNSRPELCLSVCLRERCEREKQDQAFGGKMVIKGRGREHTKNGDKIFTARGRRNGKIESTRVKGGEKERERRVKGKNERERV